MTFSVSTMYITMYIYFENYSNEKQYAFKKKKESRMLMVLFFLFTFCLYIYLYIDNNAQLPFIPKTTKVIIANAINEEAI